MKCALCDFVILWSTKTDLDQNRQQKRRKQVRWVHMFKHLPIIIVIWSLQLLTDIKILTMTGNNQFIISSNCLNMVWFTWSVSLPSSPASLLCTPAVACMRARSCAQDTLICAPHYFSVQELMHNSHDVSVACDQQHQCYMGIRSGFITIFLISQPIIWKVSIVLCSFVLSTVKMIWNSCSERV